MSIRRCLLLLGTVLSLLAQGAYASTEQRLALLIGNSAYKSSPLLNPSSSHFKFHGGGW